MRLLFASHTADLMGAELTLVALVHEAALVRGHEVTVLLPCDGPLHAELSRAGADVRVLPTRLWMGRRHNMLAGTVRLLQVAASIPRYRRYLSRARPDMVITNSAVVPAAAIASRMVGLPHVWVVHESILTNPNLRSVVPRRDVARLIGRLAAGVVAVSDYVAGQLLSVEPSMRDKLRVISPPITSHAPGCDPATPRSARTIERLLLLGEYSPEKGQDDAISAVGACLRQGHAFQLKLVGVANPQARDHLMAQARTQGVAELVEVSGWTADPWTLYAWADATLMLSRNEAYGRVTVESLMCGTPVIGFRAGCTTEILAAGGGVLVEPSADALAAALIDLAEDPGSLGRLADEAESRQRRLASTLSSAAVLVEHLELLAAGA